MLYRWKMITVMSRVQWSQANTCKHTVTSCRFLGFTESFLICDILTDTIYELIYLVLFYFLAMTGYKNSRWENRHATRLFWTCFFGSSYFSLKLDALIKIKKVFRENFFLWLVILLFNVYFTFLPINLRNFILIYSMWLFCP